MIKKKVLFVCLGNICRSPAADGIFHELVKKENLQDSFFIDSAGTSAFHAGEKADPRMREAAAQRGYKLESISRQFVKDDFKEFDFIIAMDESNKRNMLKLASTDAERNKVSMMSDYCTTYEIREVPDPYYGNGDGFNYVIDILEDGCSELLKKIKAQLVQS